MLVKKRRSCRFSVIGMGKLNPINTTTEFDSNDTASQNLPRHVAIIMDGNGRWAQKRNLPRIAGHKKGAETVRTTIEACGNAGIEYLTLYAFSSENWKRPEDEVTGLMGLLRHYVVKELDEMHDNGIRLQFIGRLDKLADDIQDKLKRAAEKTKNNTKLTVVIALNYGARAEILDAMKTLYEDVSQGKVSVNDLDEDSISNALYTKDIPDPDLIIRTSGEERLSNFLLWQSAYAELVFVDELWPDFDEDCFNQAIKTYALRERRYGASK